MSLALLAGGALFLLLQHLGGQPAVIAAAVVLLVLELAHDLRLYRRP